VFFETLAYVIAFGIYLVLRHRFSDPVATPLRWATIAAAVAGAAIGSKLLFWLEDPQLTWHSLHNPAYLAGGKTIVGALAFGLLTVELTKRYIGLRQSTGDLYAIPLALGIALGPSTSATASLATQRSSMKLFSSCFSSRFSTAS
jgi:phosphatidylglycerol---prolipoprotein diacylglyceryl transferase